MLNLSLVWAPGLLPHVEALNQMLSKERRPVEPCPWSPADVQAPPLAGGGTVSKWIKGSLS